MGVRGFWLGFLISLIMLDIGVGYLVLSADWSSKASQDEKKKELIETKTHSTLAMTEANAVN